MGAHDLAVLALCYGMADDNRRGHWPSTRLIPHGMERDQVLVSLLALVDDERLEIVESFGRHEVGGRLACGYYLPVMRGPARWSDGFVWQLVR
jgi:hypothetical protein